MEVKLLKKKFFCILFSVLLLFSYTASATYYNDEVNDKAMLLSELGIIEEIADETKLDEEVTRRDFVIAVAKMLGIDPYISNGNRYYRDMTEDDLAWNAANALLERGILSANDSQTFRPDDIITRNEAASVVIKALGFTGFDYETTIKVAQTSDVLKGVTVNNIRMRDMAVILNNMLNTYVFENKGTNPTNFTLEQSDETFMEVYYDLYHVEGVVTEVNDTSLVNTTGNGDNTISIGDTVINTDEGADMYEYLGSYASAYYTDVDDYYKLIYISVRESKTEKITIEAENISDFNPQSYVLKYREDDRTKTQDISKGASIVRNGENVSNDIANAFNGIINGSVTLIESDNERGYETVIINSYTNVVVQYTDVAEKKIYGTHNEVISLEENATSYIITTASGEVLALEDIAKNNVVSLYASSDLNRLVVSSSSVTGAISSLSQDDEETYITIDSTQYRVDNEFLEKSDFILTAGVSVTCYVDAKGKIADIVAERSTNGIYAWVINCFAEDYDRETLFMKAFTENNEMAVMQIAERVKIDGSTYSKANEKKNALATNGAIGEQLVVIELNADGEIKAIDTVKEGNSENGLLISSPMAENYFFAGQMLLGPTMQITSSSKLFIIPNSTQFKNDADAYKVVNGNTFFKDWELYNVEGYRVGSKDTIDYTEAMILKTDLKGVHGFATTNKNVFIVSGVKTVYDEDIDDNREEIELISGKSVVTYMNAENYSFLEDDNIKVGNIIRIRNNSQGEVVSTTLVYGETVDGEVTDESTQPVWATRDQYALGYITALDNGLLALSAEKDSEPFLIVKTANISVGVYDPEQYEQVYVGGEEDIIDAYNKGYKIVIDISRGVVRTFSVVKK